MKTVKLLEIIIIVGVGYFLGKKILNLKQKIASPSNSNNKPIVESEDVTSVKQKTQVSIPPLSQNEFNEDLAREEFIRKADSFTQLYEAFYQVAAGTSPNSNEVIADWNTRIHNLNGNPNIQQKWDSLFTAYDKIDLDQLKEKVLLFLKFIYSTGIKRDNNDIHIVDETTRFRYYTLNGEDIIVGKEMKVIAPCWFLNNKIIEKGILIN